MLFQHALEPLTRHTSSGHAVRAADDPPSPLPRGEGRGEGVRLFSVRRKVNENLLSRSHMKPDHQPGNRAAALPLLLWRRRPGRGGSVHWFPISDLRVLDLRQRPLRIAVPPAFQAGLAADH